MLVRYILGMLHASAWQRNNATFLPGLSKLSSCSPSPTKLLCRFAMQSSIFHPLHTALTYYTSVSAIFQLPLLWGEASTLVSNPYVFFVSVHPSHLLKFKHSATLPTDKNSCTFRFPLLPHHPSLLGITRTLLAVQHYNLQGSAELKFNQNCIPLLLIDSDIIIWTNNSNKKANTLQACLKSAWGVSLQTSQDFEALWGSETCGKLSGLLVLCPLLLFCDDWKQVTAHLTACVLWYSCYAESSTCKHLHDSCLLRASADHTWHLGSTFTTPFVHGIALFY